MRTPAPRWTRSRIVLAIREWTHAYGRPPTYNEWRRGDPQRRRPTSPRVQQVLGSWTRAIVEAGLEPRAKGGRPAGELCMAGLHFLAVEGYVSPDGRRHCRACVRERERLRRRQRAARRAYLARLRARRIELGFCTRCGKAPAEAGRACCSGCLAYMRAADQRRRRLRQAA